MTPQEQIHDLSAAVSRLTTRVEELAAVREIVAERINIVDSDGTTRLVISGKSRFPQELTTAGATLPHERPLAGLLFFNDDGSECGGLAWHGGSEMYGKGFQGGSLTFDRLHQDQTVQVIGESLGDEYSASVRINEVPKEPTPLVNQRVQALVAEHGEVKAEELLAQEGLLSSPRVYLGRRLNGDAVLELSDAHQRVRLRLAVTTNGAVAVETLNTDGDPTSLLADQLGPE